MQFQVSDITVEIVPPKRQSTDKENKEDFSLFLYKIIQMNVKKGYL